MGKITGFMEFERIEEGYKPVPERLKHYKEFVIGLSPEQAKDQSARCMDCGTPFCNSGCPVNNIIPDFNDLVFKQDWKAAIDAFGKVIASKPDSADAHNYLGYSHRQLDQLEQSFTHYNEALRIDPNHRGANEYIGQAYLRVGKPEKATEHLARLEKICGKNCEEYQDLARAIAAYNKDKSKS